MSRHDVRLRLATAGTILLAATAGTHAVVLPGYQGPSPYLSIADSPFNGIAFTYSYVEDFEDGALNTPGVAANFGIVGNPSTLTDSVDGDDGAIDGSGAGGHSWFSSFSSNSFTFTFDAGALGNLPTYAGIVWTDVGNSNLGLGQGTVSFVASGPGNLPYGGAISSVAVGDGSVAGGTSEDRFFGIYQPAGISSLTISMSDSIDWEVDHLQYAYVPEPVSALLLAAGVVLCRRGRRD